MSFKLFRTFLFTNKLQRISKFNSKITCYSQASDIATHENGSVLPYFVLQQVQDELKIIHQNCLQVLQARSPALQRIIQYHFMSAGKMVRPLLVVLMSATCNHHCAQHIKYFLSSSVTNSDHNFTANSISRQFNSDCELRLTSEQRDVAMITEMIHTASLMHDDLLDSAAVRRGQISCPAEFGHRQAVLAGDFILGCAAQRLGGLGHADVISVLSRVLLDLVQGEFMQLGSREAENDRFNHYLTKTYRKTASLMANSCKAVALLSLHNLHHCKDVVEQLSWLPDAAYEFGRHIGILFQLVDDILDFESSEADLGKPTASDVKLGIATAPVLFASQQFPDLHELILRRFSEPGDVERTLQCVHASNGIQQSRLLAQFHLENALREANKFTTSGSSRELITLAESLLNRTK